MLEPEEVAEQPKAEGEEGEEDDEFVKIDDDEGTRKRKKSSKKSKSSKAETSILNLNVFENDEITSLKELVKSDFEMQANDKDFKLSFE